MLDGNGFWAPGAWGIRAGMEKALISTRGANAKIARHEAISPEIPAAKASRALRHATPHLCHKFITPHGCWQVVGMLGLGSIYSGIFKKARRWAL